MQNNPDRPFENLSGLIICLLQSNFFIRRGELRSPEQGELKKPPLCKGRWLAKRDGGIVKIEALNQDNPSPPTAELPICEANEYTKGA